MGVVDPFVIGVVSARVDAAEDKLSGVDSGITDGLAAPVDDEACRGAWSRTASRAVEDPDIRGTRSTGPCDKGPEAVGV